MDLELIQNTVASWKLSDDDIIWNVYMPDDLCDCCGGNGVKSWDLNNRTVLCPCILVSKDRHMTFSLLKRLSLLTKDEV